MTVPTNVGYEKETKEIAAKCDAAVQSKVREGVDAGHGFIGVGEPNMTVKDYIIETFPKTLRNAVKDEDTLLGLPYPYTVPCAESYFNELFYWDTYFTNKALIIAGDFKQAKNNVLDIAALIERFGYMPNGSRTYFLKRSQPPYFALMVDDIYKAEKNEAFLKAIFPVIEKEYGFWMTKRISDNGLNHYYTEEDDESCKGFYTGCVAERIGLDDKADFVYAGRNYFAECESGWDFTPRFGGSCSEFNPVDLNSNLYLYEKLLCEYEILLKTGDGTKWREKAETRAELINKLLWDSDKNVYKDYNFNTGKLSETVSAAAFQPYFAGLADKEKSVGLDNLLKELQCGYGLFATGKTNKKYQWAYPNVWAPYHVIAVDGLLNYGLVKEALVVANEYTRLIETNFEKTGKLYEKYNGETGGTDAVSEYGTPEMLGWTAGAYMYLSEFIKDHGDA